MIKVLKPVLCAVPDEYTESYYDAHTDWRVKQKYRETGARRYRARELRGTKKYGLYIRLSLTTLSKNRGAIEFEGGAVNIEICDPRKKIIATTEALISGGGLKVALSLSSKRTPSMQNTAIWNGFYHYTMDKNPVDVRQIRFKSIEIYTTTLFWQSKYANVDIYMSSSRNRQLHYANYNHQLNEFGSLSTSISKKGLFGKKFSKTTYKTGTFDPKFVKYLRD